MLPPAPLLSPTPAGRFACIIENLCRALAARMAKHPAIRRLLWLAWTRLRRASARFTRLAARLDAGPLPPPRPRSPRPPNSRPRPPALRLPSARAWLIRLVPEAAPFGSQLQYLLSQPDMQALLATAPQAARIFRPLCRALAAQPHPPLPPPPPRPATAAKPRAKPPVKPAVRPHAKPAAKAPAERRPAAQSATSEVWPSPGLGSFILPKTARSRPA